MAGENEFLLHALSLGVFITFVYDLLRIFRRVFPHKNFLISLEDLLFWIYCAVKVFLMMYYENNGTLRWFAILGALAGMLLYLKLVSPFLVKYGALILQKTLQTVVKPIKFLLRPVSLLADRIAARVRREREIRAVKRIKRRELGRGACKKKLTALLKVFKMSL